MLVRFAMLSVPFLLLSGALRAQDAPSRKPNTTPAKDKCSIAGTVVKSGTCDLERAMRAFSAEIVSRLARRVERIHSPEAEASPISLLERIHSQHRPKHNNHLVYVSHERRSVTP